MEFKDVKGRKAVFWDFDETLAIHTKEVDDNTWHRKIITCDYSIFDDMGLQSNLILAELMDWIFKQDVPQYLLSHVSYAHSVEMKRKWVHENYTKLTNAYGTATREDKVVFLKAFAFALTLSRNEIIIIDDNIDTLKECIDAGFSALSPMRLMGLYWKDGIEKTGTNLVSDSLLV